MKKEVRGEVVEVRPSQKYMDGIVQRTSAEVVVVRTVDGEVHNFVTGSLNSGGRQMTMIYAAASIKAMLRDAANDLAEAIEERKPWHVIYEAMCRVERLAVDLRLERRDSSAHT